MTSLMFGYEGLQIEVNTDGEDDATWLREFLLPWFAPSGGAPDVTVKLTVDKSRFEELLAEGARGGQRRLFMLDTRTVDLPCWQAAGQEKAFYHAAHCLFFLVRGQTIELVAAEPQADSRIDIMRTIRELAMGVAQLSGHRFLHASAFAVGDRAALISGPREAGKTSLLTYALTHAPGGFIGNDRVLAKTRGTATRIRGMPTIVSIRDGTMDLFPGMREEIAARYYRSRATLAEAQRPATIAGMVVKQGGASITPRQFCTLLQCDPVPEAQATVLLFPRQTGRPGGLELHPLNAAEASARLQRGLFGHIGPDRLSDVFTVFPPHLVRRQAPDDTALCRQLATAVPAWECLLGQDSYRDRRGADELVALLNSSARTKAAP